MQTFADDLAGEYVRHFTQQELVIGAEAEARLAKTLIKRVSLADTLKVAQEMCSNCSCIVKVEHHTNAVAEAQLLKVCAPNHSTCVRSSLVSVGQIPMITHIGQ
jgi:hypothetical protein